MKSKQKTTQASAPPERLQKVMAAAGLGSRRALEAHIKAGRVAVNGEPAEIGRNAGNGDVIAFEGRQWRVLTKPVQQRSLIYNKPEGEITTRSDPAGRKTVFERMPPIKGARWVAVGRLDINTTGLLLMTTDGELAHVMMHPSSKVDREYACRIRGEASLEQLDNLKNGVELSDGMAAFNDIQSAGGSGGNSWYHVTILEGRNREVRRLWQSQGLTVSRLKRVRYGAVFLPKRLRMGQWSEISARDHEVLREDVGLATSSTQLSLQELRGRSTGPGKKKTHIRKTSKKKSGRQDRSDKKKAPNRNQRRR